MGFNLEADKLSGLRGLEAEEEERVDKKSKVGGMAGDVVRED